MTVSFKEVRKLKKYYNKNVMFCEGCLGVNPEMEQGYTQCCNELRITYPIALRMAKQEDILNALQLKFTASSNGDLRMYSSIANFVLPIKEKKFSLNMEHTEKDLIKELSENIKGLRKEF